MAKKTLYRQYVVKFEEKPLGITLALSQDAKKTITVKSIKDKSVAMICGQISIGDTVIEINSNNRKDQYVQFMHNLELLRTGKLELPISMIFRSTSQPPVTPSIEVSISHLLVKLFVMC